MDFASYFDGYEDTGFVPVMESCVAYAEFLHYFLLGHESLDSVFSGGRDYLIKDTLNNAVGETEEVLVFYGDVEVGDAAFNKCFDV